MIEMSIVEEEVTDKDIDEPDLKGLRIPNHCILLRPIRVDKKLKAVYFYRLTHIQIFLI